jgi:hypothetical protein
LALFKACLATILIYLLSVIKFPKWVIEAINSHMAKYHLSNWASLTQRKHVRGG